MLLQHLHLNNFRGGSGIQLDELRPVNLVVGTNNAGKSSVLEAASLLLRPHDPANWIQTSRHRDESMAVFDGIWGLFPKATALRVEDGEPQIKRLKVSGVVHGLHRDLAALVRVMPSFPMEDRWDVVKLTFSLFAHVTDDGEKVTHTFYFHDRGSLTVGPAPSHKSYTLTPGAHRSGRVMIEFFSEAVEAGQKQDAVELVRLFDPQIRSIDLSSSLGRVVVRALHEERGVVDLASFGDGLRRAALFGFALRRASGGVLMIDELEGGVHSGLLGKVLRALVLGARQADVQILATTHSLEALDALVDATADAPSDLAVYHLRRGEAGQAEALRFDGDRVRRLRASGLDLR